MSRKVLIILYYWPPAGGPGVQRWLYFVRYLREFGIEPVLFLPKKPNYPIIDSSLEDLIPENVKVYKSDFWEPYALAAVFGRNKTKRLSAGIIHKKKAGILERLLLWIRGNLFIPDARRGWLKPALKKLPEILRKEGITTVITSGPPHSLHLIGLKLRDLIPIRWIADFRDPWTDIGYMESLHLGKRAIRKHKELEQKVLQGADAVITTSEHTKLSFKHLTSKPIHVITNGFDTPLGNGKQPKGKFVLSHIGSLLSERNPEGLWRAIESLCIASSEFKEDIQLELTGIVSQEVLDQLKKYNLYTVTRVNPYVSHLEALQLQQQAQILLLLEIDAPKTIGILPGKMFEYMAASRPILAIGPEGWEAASIIESSGCGRGFTNEQQTDIKQQLILWYEKYKSGELEIQPGTVASYSRKQLTERLVNLALWE